MSTSTEHLDYSSSVGPYSSHDLWDLAGLYENNSGGSTAAAPYDPGVLQPFDTFYAEVKIDFLRHIRQRCDAEIQFLQQTANPMPHQRNDTDWPLRTNDDCTIRVPSPATFHPGSNLPDPPIHAAIPELGERCRWNGCSKTLKCGKHHFQNTDPKGRCRIRCQWAGCREQRHLLTHSIAKHIATQHLGALSRRCPVCDNSFSRVDALRRHIKNAHGGDCQRIGGR
ncbi:hypothetical protein B0H21DRAFT_767991 [Amylocystis lapponica]|nr:hypothetical protein B0H21DRAFT_767991 [Amylocystis lapponica]